MNDLSSLALAVVLLLGLLVAESVAAVLVTRLLADSFGRHKLLPVIHRHQGLG